MENFDSTTIELNFKITTPFAISLMLKTLDFLLWNRSQLPFTFDILQNFVNSNSGRSYKSIIQATKARTTYNDILTVKKTIESEFFNAKSFLVIFGSSITTAKEAFKIKFPTTSNCISPNFVNETSMQKRILLKLIQAENFKKLFSNPLSITNVFILIERLDDDGLTQGLCKIKNFKLNRSCKKYAIHFNDVSDFEIFSDDFEELKLSDLEAKDVDEEIWYQSKVFIKGFNKIVEDSM